VARRPARCFKVNPQKGFLIRQNSVIRP
jgi:hypothetical protein